MRMWNIYPSLMCNKHLLGEHVEMHVFIGALKSGRSIDGHINKNQIQTHNTLKRHDELANEMIRRGMKHASPLEYNKNLPVSGIVYVNDNIKILAARCESCRIKQQEFAARNLAAQKNTDTSSLKYFA